MNLDQVMDEDEDNSSSSSDLEILEEDNDDLAPDAGTDNTFMEAEEAKAIEEGIDKELADLTEPEFDTEQPHEEIDVQQEEADGEGEENELQLSTTSDLFV